MNQLVIFDDLKPGDRVRHKLTEEIYMVQRVNENVVSCNTDKLVSYPKGTFLQTHVCLKENLIKL